MPTVIYQSDLDCTQRITHRLAPYPNNGRPSECGSVTTNPTRCITRVYLGGLQGGAPMQDQNDGYGSGSGGGGYSGGANGTGY
jgi:hypothetical protein